MTGIYCLDPSVTWSGLWPAVIAASISALIIVAGYFLQFSLFKEQLKKQHEETHAQIQTQNIINQSQITLNIKQTLLEMAVTKARDCNLVFEQNGNYVKGVADSDLWKFFVPGIISELVISGEQIDNAIRLFKSSHWQISQDEEISLRKNLIYTFWKQLNTRVRFYYCKCAIRGCLERAKNFEDVTTYAKMLIGIYDFCSIIGDDMENKPSEEILQLKKELGI